MAFRAVAAVAALTAVAGCGSGQAPSAAPKARPLAVVASPPPQPPAPPTGGGAASARRPDGHRFPPCNASELRATTAGRNGLTGGTLIDYVVLRNVSRHNCSLSGAPTLAAQDGDGRPVALHRAALDGDFHNARVSVALMAHPRHASWSEAEVPFSLSGLDDAGQPCAAGHFQRIQTVLVSIPGSGEVAAPVPRSGDEAGIGTCDGRFRSGNFIPAT